MLGVVARDYAQRIGAPNLAQRAAHGLFQVTVVVHLDEVRQDLGVGLAAEHVPHREVLARERRSVVPRHGLAEADQFAVDGWVDVVGEDQVEHGPGGLPGDWAPAEVAEPRPRGGRVSTMPGQTEAIRVPSARSCSRRSAATARTAATWATFEGTFSQTRPARPPPRSCGGSAVRQDSTAYSTWSRLAPSKSGCSRGSRWPRVPRLLATTSSRPPGRSTGAKERSTAWVAVLETSMNSSARSACDSSGSSAGDRVG